MCLQVHATDADGEGFGELSFSLSDEDSDKPFSVVELNDDLALIIATEPLDFEQAGSYTLTVIVEDDLLHFNTTTVNVTVINLNDNFPVFVTGEGIPVDTVQVNVSEEIEFPFTVYALQVGID